MTIPVIKVKVSRKATVKARVVSKLPASVFPGVAIAIAKANGAYTIGADYSLLNELSAFDPTQEVFLVRKRDGTWATLSLSTFINNSSTTSIIITAGATYAAGINDKLIVVNKTVGSATAITLPLASSKVGPVRIVDFKGDANVNNVTITPSGSDAFNGGLTSWKITGAGASLLFSPIGGLGYAVS